MGLTITKSMWTYTPNVPGQESVVARLTIPRGWLYRFRPGAKFTHTLAVEETFSAVNDEETQQEVQLAGDVVIGPWRLERVAAAQHVAEDGTVLATGVVSVQGAANKVTVRKAPNQGGLIRVQYLTGDGYIRIMREAPTGSSMRRGEAFADTYDILHRTDQVDRGSILQWVEPFTLLEDWSLVVVVNVPHPVAWTSDLTVLTVEAERMNKATVVDRLQANGATWEQYVAAELARLE